jgi:hypothetical protein
LLINSMQEVFVYALFFISIDSPFTCLSLL